MLSLALVPDDGDELYLTLESSDPLLEWVERHVVPYLDHGSRAAVLPAAYARAMPRMRLSAISATTTSR